MKKIAALLLAVLLLALTGCGGQTKETEPAPTAAPVQTPEATEVPAVTEAPTAEPETVPEPADDDKIAEIVEQVLAMEGQPVEDLLDWLGEPLDRDYSSSCLVTGGQDGELIYDGFTVYTLVQPDGTETVYYCEAAQ